MDKAKLKLIKKVNRAIYGTAPAVRCIPDKTKYNRKNKERQNWQEVI
jgi:hypothetical protein